MPTKIITGNIFTTNCDVIVNTVNCVGVMGAGIALECRLRYPDMYVKYKSLCKRNLIQVGKLWLYKSDEKWILNFPTKRDWKFPSKAEFIHKGLQKFTEVYEQKDIQSIAFPMLGADKGGIKVETTLSLLQEYLDPLPIDIELYQYDPEASDDLFDKLAVFLLSNDVSYLSNITKIRKNYIEKAIEASKSGNIKQLNQLGRVEGIGIKTLEKLFITAQDSNFESGYKQESLI
jgi:O-acetyl-ADP-ribose deacetylase (regulator of RNase III)